MNLQEKGNHDFPHMHKHAFSHSSKSTAPLRFVSARRNRFSSVEPELCSTGASTSFSAAISAGADSAWLELQSAWRLKTSRMNDSSAMFWATEMVWVNSVTVSGAEGWLRRAAAEEATATADRGE